VVGSVGQSNSPTKKPDPIFRSRTGELFTRPKMLIFLLVWLLFHIEFHSLDVRGKPFQAAKHWSAETPFGKRAHFRTVSEPARLVVDEVKVADQGVYRCRVDFRNSPSRETRLNLTIAGRFSPIRELTTLLC